MKDFGVNRAIKQIIDQEGKRPSFVADRAGIRRDTFSRIIHSRRPVYAHELQPIAWALGVPVENLLKEVEM